MKINQGSYEIAVVVALNDPENRPVNADRVKVRILRFHGPLYQRTLDIAVSRIKQKFPGAVIPSSARVEDEFLPWAQICYPLGVTKNKNLLKEKEVVYVTFPGGDTNYPLIIGTSGVLSQEVGP